MNQKTKQTVVINGRHYDAHSGLALPQKELPLSQKAAQQKRVHQATAADHASAQKKAIIADIAPVKASQPQALQPTSHKRARVAARSVHSAPQKSTTLRRAHLKKPVSRRAGNAKQVHRAVERSSRISRFASLPAATPQSQPKNEPDHELHRQAQVLQQKHAADTRPKPSPAPISSRAVKEHLLKKQLAVSPDTPLKNVYQAGKISRRARVMSVATTSLALVLLGGYLTYINIPNLSIRVASANSGIDATLPQYQPGGYRIHGPIAYTSGEVELAYQQNGSDQGYHITQKASDWDPQAALDNYVQPETGSNYEIHSVQGLTVYTYDNKAVWVNGGILHVIDASTPLDGSQVERIAASM